MGSAVGAEKSAATKTGCSHAEWLAHRASGKRWCYRCRSWHAAAEMRGKVCRPCNRAKGIRTRYGLSEAELAALEQSACPICERTGQKMELDHDHVTGEARGFLCSRCNGALGQFCDDPTLLLRAIAYLQENSRG